MALAEAVEATGDSPRLAGSLARAEFTRRTREFLDVALPHVAHFRPGKWRTRAGSGISNFQRYSHLGVLQRAAATDPDVAALLDADYTIQPDLLVLRDPGAHTTIDRQGTPDALVGAEFSRPGRDTTAVEPLRASVACKWRIRRRVGQELRAEAVDLLRLRNGDAPYTAVVTAEPLPSRLAPIAIGSVGVDCTYHVALQELMGVVAQPRFDDARDMLEIMVEGDRVKDILDMPLDLVKWDNPRRMAWRSQG